MPTELQPPAGCINRFASVSWKADFIVNYDIKCRMGRYTEDEDA